MTYITTTEFLNTFESLIADCKDAMRSKYWPNDKDAIAFPIACNLGWVDWFCKDRALIGRTERYGKTVRSIIKAVPELGIDTIVGFSQRYGNGYVDCIHIDPSDDEKCPYGYGIRISPAADMEPTRYYDRATGKYKVRPGDHKYYVYRSDRAWGGDFECDTIREVIAFIKDDLRLWKAGYTTKEYSRDDDTDYCYHYITIRTNVPGLI